MPNTTELSTAKRALLEKYLRGNRTQPSMGANAIPRRSEESPAPLSFGQQQLWLLAQLMPDTPAYNESQTIYLPGPLDVTVLEQSLNEIIRRHEAWRTSFPIVNGQPVQLIHPAPTLTLPVVDLRNLPESEREAEALRLATEETQRPFDLVQGPLLRTTLMRLGDMDYRLFLFEHHIIFDGFSLYQVFLPELHALYEAFSHGKLSPLQDLPIQYADFAVWQRELLQGNALADHLAYWKKQLDGAPTVLMLPTDHPRPAVPTYRGSIYPFALSKWLTEDLKALSHQEGITLFMLLAAAFQTLIYRYSGQDDILIGTATSDRSRLETQKLMGFFLNTLVLRTDLSGNPTFRELLGRVRDMIFDAHAHKDVPFEYLVREVQPERSVSQNPLFQVMLILEPPLSVLPSGWTMTQMEAKAGTSKFDLTLDLEDRPEGLIGRLEYNTDLFEGPTITHMVGHLQTLLEGIVADPERHLSELPLLTEAERRQLLVEWNATQADYPMDRSIHQLFEAQVERTPEAVAVVFEEEQLTYRELNRRANQLAHHLQKLGVGPDVLVGICVKRSLDMVVGLLGILKAGGAYVPLDPGFPAERLAFMLEDAQAPVLLTQWYLTTQLPKHGAKVVCLDSDQSVLAQQSGTNLLPAATSTNLAYVIYTSGSTGRPKGVQILHRAVVNFLLSMREQPGLREEDTLLAITTLSFDIAALELFLPLVVGARVVVASRDVVADGAVLMETLARTRTTVMQATPVTWRILLAAGWQGNRHLKILCGGEALPMELAQQLLPKAASLWNLYGPTETTIWSSVCQIKPDAEWISIGHPITNTQLYLLDAHLQPVPVGVPGELYIGGDGLARGYLNRPELTTERFIPHPFSDEPGACLYRTGDLARYRADGTIEHLGRIDFQVKIRGFRIELGEIEAVLSQHPAVRQAVVVAREDVPGDKRLVAYIVATQRQHLVIKNLRNYLKENLPEYMLPSAFMLLDTLPLTPNGKVDRRALPVLDTIRLEQTDDYVAPNTPAEEMLARIWAQVLHLEQVGIHDNFFELGGDSILSIQIIAQARQAGLQLTPKHLFQHQTIAELAVVVTTSQSLEQVLDVASLHQQAVQQVVAHHEELPPHFKPETSSVKLNEHELHNLQEDSYLQSRAPVETVQIGKLKQPFFFLHGDWTGGAFYYFTLARALGSDQPFYALAPYRIDGLDVPSTLEAMAAAHLKSLRAIQPEGPYFLGGFCSGGLLAYEMARQLHAEGQRVDLLVLIDPHSPGYLKMIRDVINRFGDLIRLNQDKHLDLFLRLRHAARHVYRYVRSSNASRVEDFWQLLALEPRLAAMFPPVEALRKDYIAVFTWLASGYVSDHHPGKITFIWSGEDPTNRAGWAKVAEDTEVEVYTTPGTHLTCITEYVHVMAEHLRMCLSKAQAAVLSQ